MASSKDTPESSKQSTPHATIQDEWKKRTALWEQTAQAEGFALPQDIDPSQIKMEVGPPMTADQFQAWMEQRKKIVKKFSKQ